MPLKDILKTLRYKAGYTQSQLADRVGVSMQGYQKWEYGQSIPSPDKIKPLAAALDVPPEMLLACAVGYPAAALPVPVIMWLVARRHRRAVWARSVARWREYHPEA